MTQEDYQIRELEEIEVKSKGGEQENKKRQL